MSGYEQMCPGYILYQGFGCGDDLGGDLVHVYEARHMQDIQAHLFSINTWR